MEFSNYDKKIRGLAFNNFDHVQKRVVKLARKTGAKKNPVVMTSNGNIMVRTGVSKTGGVSSNTPMMPGGRATVGAALTKAKKTGKKKMFNKIVKQVVPKGKGIKKIGKGVTKVVKKSTNLALLAPILPLRGVMRKTLSKRGFKAPKKTEDLVRAFHEHIVKRSSSYESMHLDHFAPLIALIPEVLDFFKNILKKKKNKQALTPTEMLVADDTVKVFSAIEKKAKDSGIDIGVPEMPGSNSKDNTKNAGGMSRKNDENETGEKNDGGLVGTMKKEIGGISTPLLLVGAGVLAFIALK